MAKKKSAKKLTNAAERSANSGGELVDAQYREEATVPDFRSDPVAMSERCGVRKEVFEAIDELKSKLKFDEYRAAKHVEVRTFGSDRSNQPLSAPAEMDNILCFGTGFKQRDGFDTPEECVKVYVRRKVPENRIAEGKIPAEIGGVPTDVEVLPEPEFRNMPYKCAEGIALGSGPGGSVNVGTIGCLCARDNKPMILTNNHVAADFDRANSDLNSGGNGDKLYQYPDMRWIGNLYDFAPLSTSQVDVDAALVHTASGYVESNHRCYEMAAEIDDIRVGDSVVKDGWKTDCTQARFDGLIFDLPMTTPYGERITHREVQVYRGYFSTGGDSGAIIVRKDNKRPVGLLWGGQGRNPYVTYATPIDTVKSVLQIDYFLAAGEF